MGNGLDSLAVIGNAPAEFFSAGAASRINRCREVIRLNNFQIGSKWAGIIGHRVTAWATTFYADIEPRDFRGRIYCTLPLLDERWHRRHARQYAGIQLDRVSKLLQSGHDLRFIPYDLYERAGRLSAGMLLLYWVYVERGWSLDGVVIEGFGFFAPGHRHHYWDKTKMADGGHQSTVEADFFGSMIRKEIR